MLLLRHDVQAEQSSGFSPRDLLRLRERLPAQLSAADRHQNVGKEMIFSTRRQLLFAPLARRRAVRQFAGPHGVQYLAAHPFDQSPRPVAEMFD